MHKTQNYKLWISTVYCCE